MPKRESSFGQYIEWIGRLGCSPARHIHDLLQVFASILRPLSNMHPHKREERQKKERPLPMGKPKPRGENTSPREGHEAEQELVFLLLAKQTGISLLVFFLSTLYLLHFRPSLVSLRVAWTFLRPHLPLLLPIDRVGWTEWMVSRKR
jgi:hypothetical protein